jgi:myo-inositol 2-dehydrogenase/D-chiro-inositol 1-dehydrogenase/scyllo-inositol 2-dehydrogenase (NAD+)
MDSLRIALIGAGRAGAVHAVNLAESTRRGVVAAIVDENRDAAARLALQIGSDAVYTSLEEALHRCTFDAVVITTPTFTHRHLVEQAASANKHIFCEKPMALSVEDCDAMIGAAGRANVVLQIGFMRRFQPEFVEAKRRIDEGIIGDPMVVKSLTRGPGLPPAWARDLRRSNGMLAEVNSHDFDCVRWLAGSDIERVYAEVANLKGPERGIDDPEFYDNAVVSLRFVSGAIGTIDGTCPADYGYDARVEVLGTKGLLVIGALQEKAVLEIRDRDTGGIIPTYRTWPERFREGYRAEMRAFVSAVLDGTAPGASGDDGRHAVRAVVAANRSWQELRPIVVLPETAS